MAFFHPGSEKKAKRKKLEPKLTFSGLCIVANLTNPCYLSCFDVLLVKIAINLSEVLSVTAQGNAPYLDSLGGLLFTESGRLWRLSSQSSEKKCIAVGGDQELKIEGARKAIERTKLDGYFCNVAEGVYWGLQYSKALMKVDIAMGESEALVTGSNTPHAGRGGLFGVEDAEDERKALVNWPCGPLLCLEGPQGGPQVFFYDWRSLRVADVNKKEIRTLNSVPKGVIYDPSRIRPSRKIVSELENHYPDQTKATNALLSDTMTTWLTHASEDATYLVDLVTGDCVLLFERKLHPLMALSSTLVLAVEVYGEGRVVLVDWTLPRDLQSSPSIIKSAESRYQLHSNSIEPLLHLPGVLGDWTSYCFDIASNQLCCFSEGVITRYSNVFKITKNNDHGIIYPFDAPSSERFIPDLGNLVLPDCPLPYDFQVTHSASNTSWKLHYDVLSHHHCLTTPNDFDRLTRIIRNSSLPPGSIEAFLRFLYFSPPVDLTNPIDAFMPLCHCIQLCNQIGMNSDSVNYLLWLLKMKIVDNLSKDALLQKMLTLWFVELDNDPEIAATYSESSPLMSLLASRCRTCVSESEIVESLENFSQHFPNGLSRGRIAALGMSLASLVSSRSSKKLMTLESSPYPPSMGQQALVWDENLSVSSRTPPSNKYSYVFTIEGIETGGIICNSLLLFPRWRWFERLCKFEGDEVRTRHVVMPPHFTIKSLVCILSVLYGKQLDLDSLQSTDILAIYRHAAKFHLTEILYFDELVKECRNRLFSTVNDGNCLEKLAEFCDAGIGLESHLFVDTLRIATQNQSRITLSGLSRLPLRLQVLISAFMASNRHGNDENFLSFATALDQSIQTLESRR